MTPQEQKACIQERRFDDLFIGQGWDEAGDRPFPLELRDGEIFQIEAKFHKRGFAVCFCNDERALRLNTAERKRLLHRLGKTYYEHLLIIHSPNEQHWLVPIRLQTSSVKVAMVQWRKGQDVQKLREKLAGLIFLMKEEETLSITDVVERVHSMFSVNAEKISKKFYSQYKIELQLFDGFIKGIKDIVKSKEYAALMLNRLMFIYFMQKKGFLGGDIDLDGDIGDINYLKNRLKQTKERLGKDEFYGFYREFLRCLFHDGLGAPAGERSDKINKILGKVPYLNGGLFDPSQLEIENDGITISDAAFEGLFKFFDKYNWHLDDSSTSGGRDINPEVLGYIFEKYINERAQMGAYYTQEDITGYIAKNTILPFLLRQARENCKNAFDEHGGVWRFLWEKPDDYIYDAVKHGCEFSDDEIPEDIRRGIDTAKPDLLERRKNWNKLAPAVIIAADKKSAEFALPTETWREVIARRGRYQELHNKLKAGEIREIDDLITYNLYIDRFVEDTLLDYEGADYIAAVFRAIAGVRQNWVKGTNEKTKRGISVLDPACGSGAFLFAALNILEPLYEACIGRMEGFIKQDDDNAKAGKGKKYPFFRKVLEEIGKHQNRRYWICKTIILENLYGVDIMAEAAEITKLRLFLKLAAEAEYKPKEINLGLEPLPDIDYNIRSGNSLVGFASMKEFESVAEKTLLDKKLLNEVREQAKVTQLANDSFRQAQDRGDSGYVKEKQDLAARLTELNEKLNQYLAEDYGKGKDESNRYEQWKATHQPFHWLADFYGIIEENGGFDVVIGNPPYVEYTKKFRETYTIRNYETESCGNLYAMLMERADKFHADNGNFGMIVPSSVSCTDGYIPIQSILFQKSRLHISSYSDQRGKLFDIPHPRLSIVLYSNALRVSPKIYATTYSKLGNRKNLFKLVKYINVDTVSTLGRIPRFCCLIEENIWKKIFIHKKIENHIHNKGKYKTYYTRKIGWFLQVGDFIPKIYDSNNNIRLPSELKTISFSNKELAQRFFAILNSSLFYWFITVGSDCRNLNKRETYGFPISLDCLSLQKINDVSIHLSQSLRDNSSYKKMRFINSPPPQEELTIQCLYPQKSKHIIDKIDTILAQHYGFTDEELDYIINYDIKYRMGGGNNE